MSKLAQAVQRQVDELRATTPQRRRQMAERDEQHAHEGHNSQPDTHNEGAALPMAKTKKSAKAKPSRIATTKTKSPRGEAPSGPITGAQMSGEYRVKLTFETGSITVVPTSQRQKYAPLLAAAIRTLVS